MIGLAGYSIAHVYRGFGLQNDKMEKFFEKAKKLAPIIVLLDDMDKFANGDERHPDAEEYVTVQSCIDEAKGKEVFVLATVNNMRCLPRSLHRAGRFDRVIEIDTPRGKDALAIIAHYLKSKKVFINFSACSVISSSGSGSMVSVISFSGSGSLFSAISSCDSG